MGLQLVKRSPFQKIIDFFEEDIFCGNYFLAFRIFSIWLFFFAVNRIAVRRSKEV